MLKQFTFLLLCFCCLSCGQTKQQEKADKNYSGYQYVTADHFALFVPVWMNYTTELNSDATLQYMNTVKEVYVVVIEEAKDDVIRSFRDAGLYDDSISLLDNYRMVQVNAWKNKVREGRDISEVRKGKIKGMNAELIHMTGKVGDSPEIYYQYAFVEAQNRLYTIVGWTLESRKERYRTTILKMIRSFRLINNQEES